MCRWLAYSGKKIFMDRLITRPVHSLVAQSLDTTMNFNADGSLWTTNGDGFGVGWYDKREEPGLFKDSVPAWNDDNLHELCSQTEAHTFMAHIRASTGGGVQRSNSHPFKHKKWLFQHNGHIGHFPQLKRNLQYEVSSGLFPQIKGSTDSETCFYLALTFGLEDSAKKALEKMIQAVEKAQVEAGLEKDVNLSCALSDGDTLYTIRYASGASKIKTQFYSTDMSCIKDFSGVCSALPDSGVVVVSEPLDELCDKWNPVPENSFSTVTDGNVTSEPLQI